MSAPGARALAPLLGLWLLSCERGEPAGAPAPSAHPPALPSAPEATPAREAAHDPAPRTAPSAPEQPAAPVTAPCRALRVQGEVRTSTGELVSVMSALSGTEWIRLGKGAELAVRHATSAREFVLGGAGSALPCRRGYEQVLLESGSFKSGPGTGARPGAEVWIGTPFGTARYGDADFVLDVSASRLELVARSGSVWMEPLLAKHGRPADGRVVPGRPERRTGNPDATALSDLCSVSSRQAREAAESVGRGGSPGLGERAAAQMLLQRRARAACLSAAAALPRIKDQAFQSRLLDQIQRAEQLPTKRSAKSP